MLRMGLCFVWRWLKKSQSLLVTSHYLVMEKRENENTEKLEKETILSEKYYLAALFCFVFLK